MTLEILQKEMIAAMKAKDKPRKEVISSLVEATKKAGIDAKCRDNVPEEMVNKVILKELKTVQEMIDTCPAGRVNLLELYIYRKRVIQEFAPTLMSEDEIKVFVEREISQMDAAAIKNKGTIMKAIMPKLKGKADGKLINKVITEYLNK